MYSVCVHVRVRERESMCVSMRVCVCVCVCVCMHSHVCAHMCVYVGGVMCPPSRLFFRTREQNGFLKVRLVDSIYINLTSHSIT